MDQSTGSSEAVWSLYAAKLPAGQTPKLLFGGVGDPEQTPVPVVVPRSHVPMLVNVVGWPVVDDLEQSTVLFRYVNGVPFGSEKYPLALGPSHVTQVFPFGRLALGTSLQPLTVV